MQDVIPKQDSDRALVCVAQAVLRMTYRNKPAYSDAKCFVANLCFICDNRYIVTHYILDSVGILLAHHLNRIHPVDYSLMVEIDHEFQDHVELKQY